LEAWERAHAAHGQGRIESGQKGVSQAQGNLNSNMKCLIKACESFSIRWTTLFVRLIFTHSVKPAAKRI